MQEPMENPHDSRESKALARLDRKRQTDRRAQRAVRERRQKYIDSLLQQIETLSGLPHDQVHEFFQSNERLRAENECLRGRTTTPFDIRSERSEEGNRAPSSLDQLLQSELVISPRSVPTPNEQDHSDAMTVARSCSPHYAQPKLFEQLPDVVPPTCLPDRILADFVCEVKRGGTSARPCVSCPDVWLFFQPRPPQMSRCPSTVLIDLVSTFPDIVLLSEQVASFIFMFKLLNWECHPTLENYNSIPEWLRPIPIQLRIPHPAWMDRIPWPRMRGYLISQQATFSYDEFSTFYRGGLTVSWPYPAADILISCPSESCCSRVRINPAFEHHVMDLGAWSLKESFLNRFPIFRDAISVK